MTSPLLTGNGERGRFVASRLLLAVLLSLIAFSVPSETVAEERSGAVGRVDLVDASAASGVRLVISRAQGARRSVQRDDPECSWEDLPPGKRLACFIPFDEGETQYLNLTTAGGLPALRKSVFEYSTLDITATAGADYEERSGTLTIKVGDTESDEASFPSLEDSIDEPDETFAVYVEVVEGSPLSADYAIMTITDNDEPPRLLIADAAGPESDGNLEFAVTLSDASAKTVMVDYGTADGTAKAGADYEERSGTLTFMPGETEASIAVPIASDGLGEGEENFEVALSNAENASVADRNATGTIEDSDALSTAILLGASPAKLREDAGATTVIVTATLNEAPREVATTVTVSVAGSGNAEAVDFAPVTDFDIVVAKGESSGSETFTLRPEDDPFDESDETVTVSGTSDLPVESAEVALADDDEPPARILLSVVPTRVSEGGEVAEVIVTAAFDRGAHPASTTVAVTVVGSGAAEAVDFAAVPDFDIVIAKGEKSGWGAFTLAPEDDEVDEADETVTVSGASDLPVEPAKVTLTDDDFTSTSITLTASPARVSEGEDARDIEVTATLDGGARTEDTTVTVTVSGSGNADAVDFAEVQDFTITISEGDRSGTGTFALDPEDDNVDESDETLTVDGSSDLQVKGDTVALADDDQSSSAILLSASPDRMAENGGAKSVQVKATLDASARTAATAVSVSVSGSGESDAVDYEATATDFDITIAAGATTGTATFTVTPEDDEVDERDEVLDVAGTSDLSVTPTTVTLMDDEQTSTEILLSAAPSTVSEGAGETPVTVTATLNAGARTVPTTVTVELMGSGDPNAVDFASVQHFPIPIAAAATSGRATFILTPEDDNLEESSETLTLDGTADLSVRSTSVTITDNDVASDGIVLSASPAVVSEDEGPIDVRVTASLNGAARQAATAVTVSVAGSGDPRAVDFQPVQDFAIMIAANAASGAGTFTLAPEDDNTAEADETVTVSGASDLPVTPTTVTLVDHDDASTRILLSAAPGRVSEGDGPTQVTVTATLDRARRQRATSVTVSVSGSGDPAASDFAAVPDFEITIAADASRGTGTFTLTPEDDATVEADERLTISGVSDLPVRPATVALADNDEVSTRILLFLTVDPLRASEGDGAIRVTVTAAVDRGVRPDETRIAVSVSGSGDPDAVDFAAVPDFEIVIPANAPDGTQTFTVVPEDDLIVEANETLTVSGVADLPVTPATMELLDDDEAPGRIVLSADPARVSEGDGPVAVTVTASLDRGLRQQATTVTVSVTGSGDPDAVDFAAVADFGITIEANAPSGAGAFTLTPEDDAEDEADETLALTGESDLPVAPASVVLADDDEMAIRVLSVADAEAAESAGEIRFAVTLDGPSAAEVTVDYATADPAGSADPVAAAGMDYESASGTLTFAPGEASQTIRVSVLDDALDEPDETFALVLSDPRGATLGRGSALGTIRDDDEPPSLSVADAAGDEDVGALEFAVTLSAPSAAEVAVGYATADSVASMDPLARAGIDYERVSGTLMFAPGEVSRTIRVPVLDDSLDEPDETFTLVLSDLQGAMLGRGSALGTIRDDDEPPALGVSDAAGDEDVGALEFEVTLSAPSGIEVSASYATTDGSATAGSDYEAATGTLAFAPGEVSKAISVPIIDDNAHEADEETFELTLSALANATAADLSAIGTIRDDDLAPPTFAGELPAALLCVGGAPYELDLADYIGGDGLRFSAVSSTPEVATAALDGSRLTVAPVSEGESSVAVAATNEAGSVESSMSVRVVTDPAEIEAVASALASIGRAVLTSVTGSVRARIARQGVSGGQGVSTSAWRNPAQAVTDSGAVVGNQWPGPSMYGTRLGGWDGRGLFESRDRVGDWLDAMNRTHRRGMAPFSFSLDSGQSGSTGPAWSVWGRGDTHRFESGIDGTSHDGTLAAVHLGADARVGDWLAGVSLASSAAEADYRFERSVDACGRGGNDEGVVDAELTSVHPYAGRQVGRGWVWATVGAGSGEVSVERCETGQRRETDLSMRLGAIGGRHPFAGGERTALSVVEEIGVLALTTGSVTGPVGNRSVTVGQARLGLEAAGVVPAGCECSLSSFVRAFARGDWGDGATGAGLELVAGVRFRNLARRLGIDAGIRALAVHSAEDASEQSANLTFSILPKADGTGWRASLAWRRGASDARFNRLGGIAPWTARSGSLPGAERGWIAQSRLGYRMALRRGLATPFLEFDAGRSERASARFGVRHEFGDRNRGLGIEWGIERSGFAGNRIVLEALGRF